jgi:hypothetical protein
MQHNSPIDYRVQLDHHVLEYNLFNKQVYWWTKQIENFNFWY